MGLQAHVADFVEKDGSAVRRLELSAAIGNRAALGGLNIVGLTRRGFSREAIHALRRAYRTLFGPEGTLKERLSDVAEEFAGNELVAKIVDFIREGGERAICTALTN